ncbi:MAG TPA: hypothetical protein ENN87_07885 [Phycisphaerales bacterium]|nr:hypothetical protein [Phycisphaerales bacterium]
MRKLLIGMILLGTGLSGVGLAERGVVYEIWQDLRNVDVGEPFFAPLYESPKFPFDPDQSYILNRFEGLRNWADHYASRLYGYVTIPRTGVYHFYVASDDQSELWLSVEGWPDQVVRVAYIDTYNATTGPPDWTEFASQKSAGFALEEGQVVYVEGLQREWEGSDHFYVGWEGPGMPVVTISDVYTHTAHPRGATPLVPEHGETLVPIDTPLTWDAPADVNDLATYTVYFGEDPNALTMPLLVADLTERTADPGLLEKGTTYYWRVEVTHSNYGDPFTVRGNIWQFTTISPVPVIVGEPQDLFIRPGETAVFAVSATSDVEMTYQWYQQGVGPIEGATTDTLTLEDVQAEGQFYCEISNDGGTTTSRTAALRLKRLIAHWPLDGDVLAKDGLGPDGQIFGAGAADPPSMFSPGPVGQAIGVNLDAEKGEYVVFGAVGISGNMPRTIACWAKNSVPVGQIANWCTIFGFTSPEALGEQSFDFNRRGDQPQYCIHRYGAEWNMHEIDGEWHFLVATFENGTVRWYVDGWFGGSATTNLQTQDLVHLGKRAHSDPVWRGWVDDARIYNYALDAYEVAQLYINAVPDAVICPEYDVADLNRDCKVNLLDFAELARVWMECGRIPVSECTDGQPN